jgi:hypothetical protein
LHGFTVSDANRLGLNQTGSTDSSVGLMPGEGQLGRDDVDPLAGELLAATGSRT